MRSAMRALGVRWGCIASAEGDGFVVRSAAGEPPVALRGAGSFFAQVSSVDELVVASREDAAAFGETHLVDFSPGLVVGVRVGATDVLVVAGGEGRAPDASESEAFLDAAVAARALLAAERTTEKLSTQLFDTAPDAMLVVSRDGLIVRANRAAEELLGYAASELLALTVEDLVPASAREGHALRRTAYATAPSARRMGKRANLKALRRDGTELAVDIMLGAFTMDDEIHVLATLRDMTAREDTLATLRATEEQLRQSQRIEALGQFAASIAHDFNNVLTVVTSYAGLIAGNSSCPPLIRDELGELLAAAERGEHLTRQLLAFARHDPPQRRAISVERICEDVRSMIGRLLAPKHELVLSLQPDVGSVFVDAVQVEQLLLNLVMNARDAMPAGGAIDLAAKRIHVDANSSELAAGAYVSIEVTDRGSGITPEVLSRMFEPLFTTKRADEGTGLGLAIVQRVLTECDGHVRVETELGRGTTFTVLLPRIASRTPPVEATHGAHPR